VPYLGRIHLVRRDRKPRKADLKVQKSVGVPRLHITAAKGHLDCKESIVGKGTNLKGGTEGSVKGKIDNKKWRIRGGGMRGQRGYFQQRR